MKTLKKISAIALSSVMLLGSLVGCSNQKETVLNEDGTSAVKSTKAIVAYNSVGYGHEWLEKCAEEFEKMYAEEGYDIELKISYNYENNASLEIGKGAAKNDTDLYLDAYNLEGLLDSSNKTMRGQGAVLVDLKDEIWNQPAVGLNKQKEEKTIAERFTLDSTHMFYDGKLEEYHGGLYVLPMGMDLWSTGIVVNPAVLEQYGYTTENLPRTTDEFNAMCDLIAEKTNETGVYAYAWAGANASGYFSYLFFEYFAQYSGVENFNNFVLT